MQERVVILSLHKESEMKQILDFSLEHIVKKSVVLAATVDNFATNSPGHLRNEMAYMCKYLEENGKQSYMEGVEGYTTLSQIANVAALYENKDASLTFIMDKSQEAEANLFIQKYWKGDCKIITPAETVRSKSYVGMTDGALGVYRKMFKNLPRALHLFPKLFDSLLFRCFLGVKNKRCTD